MKIYADRFPTAVRQFLTDLLVVVWVYAAIRFALWLHDVVEKLAVPGQKLEGAGGGLADNLADAGGKVGRVPIVGDELTAPFTRAADAARSVAEAGRDQQELVGQLALGLTVAVLVFPLGLVLFGWLPLRLRWMRRAGAAKALAGVPAGRDLLALRALAGQPLSKLTRIAPDVAEAWRRGDDATVDALAALELRELGLRGGR
ncbi:hypothetical protein AB0N38_18130 [Micromonospora aurantiaca]|uniref:Transmembrane protein n=2 Tax=Micromonospora aurantiaca (nom. illeg.) TaxID=47850 RepID=A0A3M9KLN5_9ACTN|nr:MULTISPECIES: hypothetical protein [Micromonospora]ADL48334.1 hypothetical protein Micau_4825 [Micromonospora aurantiaca ATCC 27029]AXH88521.1 hypothetical protein DVH21_00445 [Micromonospora aurantiaca]KAB1118380.1 hypothetical protein F6X54_03565 [Micromonospora aurantiaca]MBC9004245.1 hypothetical protein [Micromonospora aurantiaca]MDG4753628.1 hypothetical protein [Micromonospora sp. WMMD718]